MDGHFDEMLRRLKLTKNQWEDARAKWNGVSEHLYGKFYDGSYDKSKRLIFGSYGKKTQNRPVGDIDLLFKIPFGVLEQYKAYEHNGPAALLQKIRTILQEKYSTTDRIVSWGKVVLVEFPEGKHNIELLPGYEEDDGTFTIPNSENGGSWETFDPRYEMGLVKESNDKTGITRKLIKMIKRWRHEASLSIKSYEIEVLCVNYLDVDFRTGAPWSEVMEGFFNWLEMQIDANHPDASKITTAKIRVQKARDFEVNEKLSDACTEWRKIFGGKFPVFDQDLEKIFQLERLYPSPSEEFIEDMFPIKINSNYQLSLAPMVKANGFRDFALFSTFMDRIEKYLPKQARLIFQPSSNIAGNVSYYWKVRNFGNEAKNAKANGDLRGEISKDFGKNQKEEGTAYTGTHYVECYAIEEGFCVAKARAFVPIKQESN